MSSTDDDRESSPPFVQPDPDGSERDGFDQIDELYDAFGEPTHTFYGGHYTTSDAELPHLPDDGDVADAHAPPFTREMQICIADRSRFVVRDEWGRVTEEHLPERVERMPDGRYAAAVPVTDVLGKMMLGQQPDAEVHVLRVVQPVRPVCKHLVVQMEPPSPSQAITGTVTQGWVSRYCSARRNVAGAFMDLSNGAMKACNLREPYDAENQRLLDRFDDTLEEKSRNREHVGMFNITQQLIDAAPKEQETP